MARVSNNRTNTTRRTRATSATSRTSETSSTAATSANWAPPPLRSAGGEIVPTVRPVIDGMAGGRMNATGTTSRLSRDTSFDTYEAEGQGAVSRAFIRVDAEPLAGGCRLHVESFHARKSDKVNLWLIAEVLDQKTNELRTITLSTLNKGKVINPGSYRGNLYFDINYADVNAYLKTLNPNLKLNPGHTSLAVSARWSNGHQAGGFGRGGVFRLPKSDSTTNVVGVRAARADSDEADLPLDMQVAFPAPLTSELQHLKDDGNILSRLESEFKGTAGKTEMTDAIHKMYDLVVKANKAEAGGRGSASAKKAVEQALGKDWTVKTVNRYWIKDDGSRGQPGKAGTGLFKGFRVDDDGLPIQDPMKDTYMDDRHLGMTGLEGAIRLRTNKQATVINVKPGGGKEDDKTGIRQRVEYGLEMDAGTSVDDAADTLSSLSGYKWSGTVFNMAQREVAKLPGDVVLSNALEPWLDVTQDRHKFTVLNEKTGVEIEFSFDKVKAQTVRDSLKNRDGTAREAEFYVLEAELDHLQLQSANQGTYAAAGVTSVSAFSNNSQQEKWLKKTSDEVTMDIDPRLHELKDLENKSFRSTSSYKQFEDAKAQIVPWLFPNGLGHGRQKAAHAAEALGLLHFDDGSLKDACLEVFDGSGYIAGAEVKKAIDDAMSSPSKRQRLQKALIDGTAQDPVRFAKIFGQEALTYDVPDAKRRVADALAANGYKITNEIKKLIGKLDAQKLKPSEFEAELKRFGSLKKDADAFKKIAQKLGVSPVPVPKVDVTQMFGDGMSMSQQLKAELGQAGVDESCQAGIERFIKSAVKKGATLQTVRKAINDISRYPTKALTSVSKEGGGLKLPKLVHDEAHLLATVTRGLSRNYLAPNDDVKAFVAKVVDTMDYDDAKKFGAAMSKNPNTAFEKVKDEVRLDPPSLSYDKAAVENAIKYNIDRSGAENKDELNKFAHTALDAGVSMTQLKKVYSSLYQVSDMKVAFKRSRVAQRGLTFPKLKYDIKAATKRVRSSLKGYYYSGDIIKSGTAVERYTQALLDAGMSPSQAASYARSCVTQTKKGAHNYYGKGWKPEDLPDVPYSEVKLKRAMKKNNRNWDAKHDKFFDENFDAVIANPEFSVQLTVRNWRAAEAMQHFAKMAGKTFS